MGEKAAKRGEELKEQKRAKTDETRKKKKETGRKHYGRYKNMSFTREKSSGNVFGPDEAQYRTQTKRNELKARNPHK
jgi:hypothetical protein